MRRISEAISLGLIEAAACEQICDGVTGDFRGD